MPHIRGERVVRDSLHRLVVDSSALCCHLGNKRFYREPSVSAAKKEMKTSYSRLLEFPPEFGCFQLMFALEARCPQESLGYPVASASELTPKMELSCLGTGKQTHQIPEFPGIETER